MTVSNSSSLIRMQQGVVGDAGVGDEHLDRAAELSSTAVNAASTDAVSVTSQRTPSRPSGGVAARWVTATRSPASANARAMARPMPRLPPVTSTVRGSLMPSNLVDYRWVAGAARHTVDRCPRPVTTTTSSR